MTDFCQKIVWMPKETLVSGVRSIKPQTECVLVFDVSQGFSRLRTIRSSTPEELTGVFAVGFVAVLSGVLLVNWPRGGSKDESGGRVQAP